MPGNIYLSLFLISKFKLLKNEYRDMYQVIDDMAALTTSAQLRSGGIQGTAIIDDLMAFGQDQGWQEKVIEYAQICSHCKSIPQGVCKKL
jgi:hypothetical protein